MLLEDKGGVVGNEALVEGGPLRGVEVALGKNVGHRRRIGAEEGKPIGRHNVSDLVYATDEGKGEGWGIVVCVMCDV